MEAETTCSLKLSGKPSGDEFSLRSENCVGRRKNRTIFKMENPSSECKFLGIVIWLTMRVVQMLLCETTERVLFIF